MFRNIDPWCGWRSFQSFTSNLDSLAARYMTAIAMTSGSHNRQSVVQRLKLINFTRTLRGERETNTHTSTLRWLFKIIEMKHTKITVQTKKMIFLSSKRLPIRTYDLLFLYQTTVINYWFNLSPSGLLWRYDELCKFYLLMCYRKGQKDKDQKFIPIPVIHKSPSHLNDFLNFGLVADEALGVLDDECVRMVHLQVEPDCLSKNLQINWFQW